MKTSHLDIQSAAMARDIQLTKCAAFRFYAIFYTGILCFKLKTPWNLPLNKNAQLQTDEHDFMLYLKKSAGFK